MAIAKQKILRPEDDPEQNEFPFGDIKQEQRMSIYFKEWQGKEHYYIQYCKYGAVVVEPAKMVG